ncbi:serine/threonine protein kinase [Oceanidesulfovibrio marinus]|uniref:Serine/threonine protein kinase n=1 Tax=Oceanidesulfovibrio marinus TaxID=370038 RepID=A0A6P1ZDN5_9BACT|nr:serine/threonine protein kinase [Oceanidesulfovibrio marinus]QJT11071.1 serine/threonine protein kinase [Oceanidesulfovibrio marinus]TVM31747.1 serine/threonine protein kinase [Oceanidesulfovibrio marinus]
MALDVRELVRERMPDFPMARCGRLVTDTSEFMRIDYGDVIELGGMHYLVFKDESERRFGLEDPKYWVKRCRCLESGESKILKLVFYESFTLHLGAIAVQCYRSPQKEARILMEVRGDIRFMQGVPINDTRGNVVRVLDIIRGKPIDVVADAIEADHETYFYEHFPDLLARFITACEAIASLHDRFEKHGDVRRDHLLMEHGTRQCRWIDFDYAFQSHENPFGLDLFGLGNILLFLVGKRIYTAQELARFPAPVIQSINEDDLSLMFPHRIMNIGKLFPYIPKELNYILQHFSSGAPLFYESTAELLDDLRPVLKTMQPAP